MAKKPETFKSFMSRERTRLMKSRDAALGRRRELEQQLSEIEGELTAIQAYEQAKKGKAPRAATRPGRRSAAKVGKAGGRAPRGEKRRAVLDLIKSSNGLTRGEILESLGVKGNKSAEQSVSNALTALKKQNVVVSRDRKYVSA